MKNSIIIFSLLVACATAFFGCSKDTATTEPIPGYGISIYDIDSCSEQVIHTSPRFGQNCETGKTFLLPQPKFDSVSTVKNFFSEKIFISDSLLNAYHYVFTPGFNQKGNMAGTDDSDQPSTHIGTPINTDSDLSDSGGMPDWLKDLLWFLLFLIAAALVGWFLWWLFNQRPNSSGGNRNNGYNGNDNANRGNGAGGNGNNQNQHSIVVIREDHTPRSGADTNASLQAFFAGITTTIQTLHTNGGGHVDVNYEDENIDTSATIHVGPESDESK